MTSAGRFAAIGHALTSRIARARALSRGRVPRIPGWVDMRVAIIDAETFTLRPWPGDRSWHVTPELDEVGASVAMTAAPRDHRG